MFKGVIAPDSEISVTFSSNFTNTDVAHVLVALGRVGGTPEEDSDTASPGGFARVEMKADLKAAPRGMLRIFVDVALDTDSGMLEVKANGEPLPNSTDAIQGDTTWTYTVR
ncbi:MAG: hypothetical protein ACE5G0_06230 [Rhodothermales bacterium]